MRLADEHVQVVDDSFELFCRSVNSGKNSESMLSTYPLPDQDRL